MTYRTLTNAALTFLVGAVLTSAWVTHAQAQAARTLTIQEGTVFIDGQQVDPGALPPSLSVEGMNAQYRFSGIQRPVVELNGAFYAIGDSLEPVHANDVERQGSLVYFRGGGSELSTQQVQQRAASAQADQMSRRQEMERQYVEELRQRNKQLYERLMRERQMEYETRALAQRVRQLPEGEERAQMLDSLRTTLNDIFDLKQENRQREVQQLQARLEELQRRLEKREEMRTEMIDQRIRQLIGEQQPE